MTSETWRKGHDWETPDGETWTTLIVPHEDERGLDERRLALPKWFVAEIERDHEAAQWAREHGQPALIRHGTALAREALASYPSAAEGE